MNETSGRDLKNLIQNIWDPESFAVGLGFFLLRKCLDSNTGPTGHILIT